MSHVPSHPSRILSTRGMIGRDSCLPHNRISLDTSGNVFEDLLAPEKPLPSFFKIPSNLTSSLKREPHCSSVSTLSFCKASQAFCIETGGTYSQSCMMDIPRRPISEPRLGKFPDSLELQCWMVNLKTSMRHFTTSYSHKVMGQESRDSKVSGRSYDVEVH